MIARILKALALCALACSAAPASEMAPLAERGVSYEAFDGVLIRGIVSAPGDAVESGRPIPFAVLLHGFGRDLDSLQPFADELVARGIAAVRIDLRGHGGSRTRNRNSLYVFPAIPVEEFPRSVEDVRQLFDELGKFEFLDRDRAALVGVGEGALVAVGAAARLPSLQTVVMVDTPPAAAGFEPERSLGIVGRRPALLVSSGHLRSKVRGETLADFGLGERALFSADDFEERDRLLLPGSEATPVVLDWIERHVAAEAP
jgi:pimeloyl-ACP methyl ester carboxylesterase